MGGALPLLQLATGRMELAVDLQDSFRLTSLPELLQLPLDAESEQEHEEGARQLGAVQSASQRQSAQRQGGGGEGAGSRGVALQDAWLLLRARNA